MTISLSLIWKFDIHCSVHSFTRHFRLIEVWISRNYVHRNLLIYVNISYQQCCILKYQSNNIRNPFCVSKTWVKHFIFICLVSECFELWWKDQVQINKGCTRKIDKSSEKIAQFELYVLVCRVVFPSLIKSWQFLPKYLLRSTPWIY